LFNTPENPKLAAEAIQQMWRQNLNVNATLFESGGKRPFSIIILINIFISTELSGRSVTAGKLRRS
jgi:hypothetical protein